MASLKEKPPSFFKIFFLEFSSMLRIPPEFVKRNGAMLLQMSSLLETESGKSWDVKITTIDQHIYLTDGWPQFVKDNELSEMDFLVFYLVSESTFHVTIFGVHGCPKDPSSPVSDITNSFPCNHGQNFQRSGKDVEVLSKAATKEDNYGRNGELRRSKSFPAVIRKHHKHYMATTDIPRSFVETGIASEGAVQLQNAEGKVWDVEIFMSKDGMIRLTRGWYEFRVGNRLVVGSKCWFGFDSASGNLIVKKNSEVMNMSSAKRGRGRPPKNIFVSTNKIS